MIRLRAHRLMIGLSLHAACPCHWRSHTLAPASSWLSGPPRGQAYLAGLTFALAASPCSTPVLAMLLAYVSAAADPLPGCLLLLTYTSGCGAARCRVPGPRGGECRASNSRVDVLRTAVPVSACPCHAELADA